MERYSGGRPKPGAHVLSARNGNGQVRRLQRRARPAWPAAPPLSATSLSDLPRSWPRAVFTSGLDRQIQMSGDEVKDLKRQIYAQWIYPPVGTREEILPAAHMPPEEIQEPPIGMVA